MKGGIGNLMKQAQQLQANMQKAQAEIAAMEVTGESGGGMVKVTINGKHEAKRVQIDPSVPLDDREMVEDLVAAAINVLVIHALADAAYQDDALPRVDLASVPTLLFALLSTLFLGHVAHQLATIWMYRR